MCQIEALVLIVKIYIPNSSDKTIKWLKIIDQKLLVYIPNSSDKTLVDIS